MERFTLPAVVLAVAMVTAGCLGGPTTDPATTDGTHGSAPTIDEPTTTGTAMTTTGPSTTTRDTTDDTTTTTRDAHDRWLRGDVVEVSPAEISEKTSEPLSEVDPEYRSLYRSAIENGSVTRQIHNAPEGTGPYPVKVDGTYYDISRATVSERTVQAYQFLIERPADSEAADSTDPVAFEDLSAVDQRIFRRGLPPAEERADLAGFSGPIWYHFDNGTVPVDSRLVEGTTVITYEGNTYSVTFEESTEETFATYRYDATAVANSTAEWQRLAVQRHVTNFSTSELEGTARQKLRRAIETGGIDFHSPDPSVPSWVETLRDWKRQNRFVSYEGELYELRIYFVME